MHRRLLMSPSRRRIRIRSAADRDQCHSTRMIGFQHVRRKARPVAADLIELTRFRRAMTRIIRQHRDQFSVNIMSRQHGDSLVRRSIRHFPEPRPFAVYEGSSIHRKACFTETVRQMPGPLTDDSFLDDVHQFVGQLFFVLSQMSRMVLRNLLKNIRREPPQPRRGMGVS